MKKCLISILSILSFQIMIAQTNCFVRTDSIASGSNNIFLDARGLEVDSQGNTYITGGRMTDTIVFNSAINIVDSGSIYLMKLNSS